MGRGEMRGRDCYYYDPTERNLFLLRDGEITTQNRFAPLAGLSVNMNYDYYPDEEMQTHDWRKCDFYSAQNKRIPRRVCFKDLKDFMKTAREHFLCKNCINDYDFNAYMYNNKFNMCAGYFCDFILYPSVDRQVDNSNDHKYNESLNCMNDNADLILDYYPVLSGGRYTKQLSNLNSKYNNDYFSKMSSIYKICKKFWKPQETSPSCRIVADSSRIGTNEEIVNTHQPKYSNNCNYNYSSSKNKNKYKNKIKNINHNNNVSNIN